MKTNAYLGLLALSAAALLAGAADAQTPAQTPVQSDRAVAIFTRLDTDHDGVPTAVEERAGRGDRMDRGRGRMGRPVTPPWNPASPATPASE